MQPTATPIVTRPPTSASSARLLSLLVILENLRQAQAPTTSQKN